MLGQPEAGQRPLADRSSLRQSIPLFAKPAMRPRIITIHEDSFAQPPYDCGPMLDRMPLPRQAPRDVRRRTIWVPSDNTTILSIHPGMRDDIIQDTAAALGQLTILEEPTEDYTRRSLPIAPLRGAGRGPLSAIKPVVPNATMGDVHGSPTGKENVAPGLSVKLSAKLVAKPRRPLAQKASKPACIPELEVPLLEESRLRNGLDAATVNGLQQLAQGLPQHSSKDHGAHCEAWSEDQEAAISTAVNAILAASSPPARTSDQLHADLQLFCRQPHFAALEQQLRHSISVGVLSLPASSEVPHLHEDVALRQRFVDLWVGSYNADMLRAAVEVASGQKSRSPTPEDDEQVMRRKLAGLVARRLVPTLHLDGLKDAARDAARRLAWEETVVRSLMVVTLLDKAKTAGVLQGCLFRKDSAAKSSADVLQAFAALALPFVGDIGRTLGYMGYRVSRKQTALDDYSFCVTNLPTDLRDGVMLARLLDMLAASGNKDIGARRETTGIQLAVDCHKVSQRLTMPCQAREQMLHNVQLSLDQLWQKGIALGFKAADIVDGHRERTLSLLHVVLAG